MHLLQQVRSPAKLLLKSRRWLPGLAVAIIAGITYFALRPPLYDNDGYRDRLYGLPPYHFYNMNPHHLAWVPIQALIASVAGWFGDPTTVPFQVVGIVVNCGTLFLLFQLLHKTGGNAVFAGAIETLVAFSPQFWRLGLENRPYTLLFLVLVLYQSAWCTENGAPPSGLRLLFAGLLLLAAVLLQQATVLLVIAAVIVLIASGSDELRTRVWRGLVWGGSIGAAGLTLYLGAWIRTPEPSFFRWVTKFAQELLSPNLYDVGARMCSVKSVIGISGMLVQPYRIIAFLQDNFSNRTIVAIYSILGVVGLSAAGFAAWNLRLAAPFMRLVRTNALFPMSLLWMIFWSAFVFVWQPAELHFWAVDIFPAFVCLGMLLRERAWRRLWVFAVTVFLVSAWNIYFNHAYDRVLSVNFPPPLVATIYRHVRPGDIFIVLSQDDGLGGIDYDLLLETLRLSPRDPALAIIDDFARPAGASASWADKLRAKINQTLDSGSRVFVAAHVFDPESYNNLAGDADDPFAVAVFKGYSGAQETSFFRKVKDAFVPYKLERSNFELGTDKYFLLEHRAPGAANPVV
jgi:hypothetical protein